MYNGTLSRKPIIKDAKGNDVVDICAPTMDLSLLAPLADNFHLVTTDEAMRLDKIANEHYANVEKLDAILWANNIYNPFSIDEYELVNIPHAKNTEAFYKAPPAIMLPDAEDDSVNAKISAASDKLNKKSNLSKQERLSATAAEYGKKVKEVVPTNRLKNGETAKRVEGSNIVLGANMRYE